MAGTPGGLPIGRLGGLLTLVGLVALPFVSCGPIDIDGHEFLRNKTPDTGELETSMDEMMEGLGNSAGRDNPITLTPNRDAEGSKAKREQLFEGKDLWLWYVYLGLAGLAVIGLLLPDGVRLAVGVGLLGIGGVVFFIDRFENMVFEDAKEAMAFGGGFSWEIGAFLAVGGFVLIAIGGLRQVAPGPPA